MHIELSCSRVASNVLVFGFMDKELSMPFSRSQTYWCLTTCSVSSSYTRPPPRIEELDSASTRGQATRLLQFSIRCISIKDL